MGGCTPAQVLLSWNVCQGITVVTTTTKIERIKSIARVNDDDSASFCVLTEDQIERLWVAGQKAPFRKINPPWGLIPGSPFYSDASTAPFVAKAVIPAPSAVEDDV